MALRTWFMAAVLGLAAPAALAAPVTFLLTGSFESDSSDLENGFVSQYGSNIQGTLTFDEQLEKGTIALAWGARSWSEAFRLTSRPKEANAEGIFLDFASSSAPSGDPFFEFSVGSPTEVGTLGQLTTLLLAQDTSVGYFIDSALLDLEVGDKSVLLDGFFNNISQVPLPAAAWLFLSVLAGASGLRRITRNTASS